MKKQSILQNKNQKPHINSTIATSNNYNNQQNSIKQENYQDPIIEKFTQNVIIEEKTLNQVDFTQITPTLAQEFFSTKQLSTIENFSFPWDFKNQNKLWPKEENLKSLCDVGRLVTEPQAITLYKDFLENITQYNFNQLEEILERSFYRKIKKLLTQMKNEDMEVQIEGLNKKIKKVELYKVQNIFGVGLSTNRRKNEGYDHFRVYDDQIAEGVPCRFYIKKRMESKELAKIIIQLHLVIESDIKLQIIQKNLQTESDDNIQNVKEEQNQDENQNEEYRIIQSDPLFQNDNSLTHTYHHMVLEGQVIECEYKQLRNLLEKGQKIDSNNIAQYKNMMNKIELQIVDFDNFMNGNEIIRQHHDPAL